jgi:isocitrate lyase
MNHALKALPVTPTREQIERLEAAMLDAEQQGAGVVVIATTHHFADGLVARTILIPAGTILSGAAHKSEHLNIAHGDITVWTEAGMRRLTGYHVLPSQPGAKRVGLAHADTYWTTLHANPTNERDVTKLEDALVEESARLQSRRFVLPAANVGALQ